MRRPLRALSERVGQDLARAGFTDLRVTHLVVFQVLAADGSRLTDLAARAFVTKQSMGALVDDLAGWGYLERVPDPADGRARLIRRTARGWRAERTARASVAAFEKAWARRVGPERMRQFRRVLEEFGEAGGEPGDS